MLAFELASTVFLLPLLFLPFVLSFFPFVANWEERQRIVEEHGTHQSSLLLFLSIIFSSFSSSVLYLSSSSYSFIPFSLILLLPPPPSTHFLPSHPYPPLFFPHSSSSSSSSSVLYLSSSYYSFSSFSLYFSLILLLPPPSLVQRVQLGVITLFIICWLVCPNFLAHFFLQPICYRKMRMNKNRDGKEEEGEGGGGRWHATRAKRKRGPTSSSKIQDRQKFNWGKRK